MIEVEFAGVRCSKYATFSSHALSFRYLESLLAGHLKERDFRERRQVAGARRLLSVIWPNLDHYFADLDIRERDPAYCAMQDAEMKRLVRLLRAGAPDVELSEVTFLRHS